MPVNITKEKAKLPLYQEIRNAWISRTNETYRSLGSKFNMSHEAIRNIIKARVGILSGMPDLSIRPKVEPDE
jgi:hypothetical protein